MIETCLTYYRKILDILQKLLGREVINFVKRIADYFVVSNNLLHTLYRHTLIFLFFIIRAHKVCCNFYRQRDLMCIPLSELSCLHAKDAKGNKRGFNNGIFYLIPLDLGYS